MLLDDPPNDFAEHDLFDLAVELLLAALNSASTDAIDPKSWWRRGRNALATGAQRGQTFGEMVEVMRKDLQIPVMTRRSAKVISSISYELDEREAWPEFQRLCKRETEHIQVEARMVREMEKDAYEEESADEVEFADPFGVDFEGEPVTFDDEEATDDAT